MLNLLRTLNPKATPISRLIPFLMSLYETQRQFLQLIDDQENHVPWSWNDSYPTQKVIPVNSKNPNTTKHSSVIQEPVTFLAHSKVEAIVRKETGSSSSVSAELMPPYPREMTKISYLSSYKTLKFPKVRWTKRRYKGAHLALPRLDG